MHTVAYNVGVASDRHKRKKNIRHDGSGCFKIVYILIKQCCLQILKDEQSFLKLYFCGIHLCFQLL